MGFKKDPFPLRRAHLFILLSTILSACGPAPRQSIDSRLSTCAVLDSFYDNSGFTASLSLSGKATVDANQYRLRGKINVDRDPSGDVLIEFVSTILFGAKREDFLLSLAADTLRIVDRERGRYYEGDAAEDLLRESFDAAVDIKSLIRLALGEPPDCGPMNDVGVHSGSGGAFVFSGRLSEEPFRIVFAGERGRIDEVLWPVRLEDHGMDRLKIVYDWEENAPRRPWLREIVITVEGREWRCRITAASY
jgi:hypothetical protein